MFSVCPDCPDGKTPGMRGITGDNWAPIADRENDYVQLGRPLISIRRMYLDSVVFWQAMQPTTLGGDRHQQGQNCYKHSSLGDLPSWGSTTGDYTFRRYVCCAGSMHVCMYVCIHVRMYAYMYVSMIIYVCAYVCMSISSNNYHYKVHKAHNYQCAINNDEKYVYG